MSIKPFNIIVRKDTNQVLTTSLTWVNRTEEFKFKLFRGKQAQDFKTYIYTKFDLNSTLKIETAYINDNRYVRLVKFEIDVFLRLFEENYRINSVYTLVYNNKAYRIKLSSDRYLNFLKNGTNCVHCGLTGKYFWVERFKDQDKYHLNLYGIDESGKETMLTKDHIIPLSRGGEDSIENFQVLCDVCNFKKGNSLECELNTWHTNL